MSIQRSEGNRDDWWRRLRLPNHAAHLCRRWPQSLRPPALPATEQRFSATFTMVVACVVLGTFSLVAFAALSNPHSRVFGIVICIILAAIALVFARRTYAVIVGPDGTVIFKALSGTKVTSLSRIYRIGTTPGGGRVGSNLAFYFEDSRAVFDFLPGKGLARLVIAANPTVEYPERSFRWSRITGN
jgi:hypothetical protein